MAALKGYEEGIWIDLNDNKTRDEGEAVTRFGKERVCYVTGVRTVTVYGKITALNCAENNLTRVTTSGFSYMETLDCSSNRIAELDVNRCNLLRELICSGNTIRGKQMTALLKSLPKRTGRASGKLIIGKLQGDTGNSCTDAQKNIASPKNWEVIAD